MTTLREIRKKLHSVENIKQITKAMEMVAAARLRRAQAKVEHSKPYIAKMRNILDDLAGTDSKHPLFEKRDVKKTGVVIIAGDKGLCGSYNTAVFSAADKFLKKYTSENVELIAVGRKTLSYYQHRKWPIKHNVINWGGKITYSKIRLLANQLADWFTSKEFDEIYLIYTQSITVMTREVQVERFLNMGKPQVEGKENPTPKLSYIFEPSSNEIYDELLPRYLVSKIQTSLDEAYAAELAARLLAMRAANKNADEMITSLTLTRNKVRQSSITKEMLEITAGALNVS